MREDIYVCARVCVYAWTYMFISWLKAVCYTCVTWFSAAVIKHHDQSNLQKFIGLLICIERDMASDDEAESREPSPAINTKPSELKVGWDYKFSKTTSSFILPSTRVHNLPKQHHQLGSSVQIPNPYSKHHSMSVCIWASPYIRYVCVYMYKSIYVCV